MESLESDMSSECLVTDLVNELSSGLEIPFLLREDISFIDQQDNLLYADSLIEKCSLGSPFTHSENSGTNLCIKSESDNDLNYCLQQNSANDNSFTHMVGISSGSRSGSGSECSSIEMWMAKNELDTPPITPPDERISPENILLMPSDELKFIPITSERNLSKQSNKVKINISNKIRIQPKPISTALNVFDSQDQYEQNVICNMFGDVNSNNIKKNADSNVFLSSNKEKKKSVLSRKDLELLQAKRKQERMIRNRESAYLSRKRKKEHVAHLEKQVQDLLTENNHLRLENYSLRQKLANYEEIDFPCGKKTRSILTDSPKKATALFALVFTVCLNIGSFSSLINEIKWNKNEILKNKVVSLHSNEVRHTRSLLWADPDFNSLNSTFANLTKDKTSCPIFINQSESIRLESELRRWIGREDDYSGKSKYNISKISQYFYSGENTKSRKEPLKWKNRNKSLNPHKRNGLEMQMYKVEPNLLSFDTFFEAIHRRNDTFYLVSFSVDHLLLPALSHNKTSRPKMSLMLPAFLSNVTEEVSDQVEMMQIDCEVTNTQLLSVNENDIPSHMRPYSNFTGRSKSKNERKSQKLEDFFLNEQEQGNLVVAKNKSLKSEIHSSEKKNLSNSGYSKLIQVPHSQYNLNSTTTYAFQDKSKFSQHIFKYNIFDNILSNQTFKDNPTHFETSNSKSLLKMLMVGPNISPSKFTDINWRNKKNINNKKEMHH